uniref:Uncharacterized protein n=1 Tax=Angiostrongylus cantonensis TaxID=6313 RepID=A0A0K0DG25_ANGCA
MAMLMWKHGEEAMAKVSSFFHESYEHVSEVG